MMSKGKVRGKLKAIDKSQNMKKTTSKNNSNEPNTIGNHILTTDKLTMTFGGSSLLMSSIWPLAKER